MTSLAPCARFSREMNDFLQAHPDTQYVDLLIADMNWSRAWQAHRAGELAQGV